MAKTTKTRTAYDYQVKNGIFSGSFAEFQNSGKKSSTKKIPLKDDAINVKEDYTYLHSHWKTFESSKEKNYLSYSTTGMGKVFEVLKQGLIGQLEAEVEFFKAIENRIINDLNSKKKPGQEMIDGREDYLKKLNEFHNMVISDKKVGGDAYNLVSFKNNVKNIKKVSDLVTKELKKFLMKDEDRKRYEKLERMNKTKKGLTKKENAEYIALSAQVTAVEKNTKNSGWELTLKKELSEITNKYLLIIDKAEDVISSILASIISFSQSVRSLHIPSASAEVKRKKVSNEVNNGATAMFDLVSNLGVDVDQTKKINVGKLASDLQDSIETMSDEHFISTFFTSNGTRDFVDKSIPINSWASGLGFLYESAVEKVIIKFTGSEAALSHIFMKEEVRNVGQITWVRDVSTMDTAIAKTKIIEGGSNIYLGLSIKLRDKGNIGITNTPTNKYWKKFESLANDQTYNEYQYMRKNLIALNIFSEDEKNTQRILYSLKRFKAFEQIIYSLLLIPRILIGFFELTDEQKNGNRYKMAGSKQTDLYYTAFLYTKNEVISLADVTQAMLNIVKNTKSTNIEKMPFNISFTGVQKHTPENLLALWELKRKSWNSLKEKGEEISYSNIISEEDVGAFSRSIFESIDNSYFANAKVSFGTTTAKMKKILKSK